MALQTVTAMISELEQKTGNLGMNAAGGLIELAINNAYRSLAAKYHHPEFEAAPSHYFDTITLTGNATCVADTYTFTIANTGTAPNDIATMGTRLLGSLCWFSSDQNVRVITGYSAVGAPPYTFTVSQAFPSAQTAQPLYIAVNQYPLPLDSEIPTGQPAFYIYDLSNTTTQNAMIQKDIRVNDRWASLAGQPYYYWRRNNNILIWPAPFLTGTQPYKMQLRYAFRPPYISGNETIAPLQEEWQAIVKMDALALLLDDLYEHERAAALRDSSSRMAVEMMKPPDEEIEDADGGFFPVKRFGGW